MVAVMTNLTVIPPGTLRKQGKNAATTGLALINEVLRGGVTHTLVNANLFCSQVQEAESRLGRLDLAHRLDLALVKALHRSWLPNIVHAVAARDLLVEITGCIPGGRRITVRPADASAMLHYLFGVMGRRRSGEAAAKLMACIDIFSPESNLLGPALGMWEEAPTHPVILAIAIKQLMAAKTFEPAESELREALGKVRERLFMLGGWAGKWLEKLDQCDATLFERDRAAWDAAYANVSVEVVRQMQERGDEGPCEDDDGNPTPPSPRWQALDDLCKAQLAAESKQRSAACKTTLPAKRMRKPRKPKGDDLDA
jgi:hypothetical protein